MPSSSVAGVEYIADLIVAETASWNYNLVNELFPPCEAALILATPLSCRLHPDKLIWHYDAKCAVFCDEAGSYVGGFVRQISPASMVQAIGNRVHGSSPMNLLVDDIRVSLRAFVDSQVCFVRSTANVAAHGMAKLVVSSPIEFCWFEEPPNSIVEALFDVD
ncbi:hypothetical protein D8674_016722 [Pyrus ussuriensis x Pyrus communis]|uniref:RNase H type-1 domain-containing protein n=1 Tax=Pyrus ussuriensis x Pyrus communis TaxID=2448454 RepID=A0A5N5HG42_9ROSA|nr:hypothetical protein D8674_016722 [Pyrus ussuriensis x Pyrus communis]